MIVCHCNVIDTVRIEAAVADALTRVPAADINFKHVFSDCKVEPDCGTCLDTIDAMIAEILADLPKKR